MLSNVGFLIFLRGLDFMIYDQVIGFFHFCFKFDMYIRLIALYNNSAALIEVSTVKINVANDGFPQH